MSTEKQELGNITINVGPDLHAEIKAAASNEGESVTAFVLGAIKARLMPAPKAAPAPAAKAKFAKADEETSTEKNFDSFFEYLQQNYHNEFVREELMPVFKGFMEGKLLPSKDGRIR